VRLIGRSLACITTTLLVLSPPMQAQEIGGGWTTSYDMFGLAGDRLGSSIAVVGDVNGDGFDDILIGSETARANGAPSGGTASLYSGVDGNELFHYESMSNNAMFGHSVCSLGDVDADGFDDFAISAMNASNGSPFSGSVYVYSGASGVELFRFDGASSFLGLGSVVSEIGDLDGDGHADIMASSEIGSTGSGTIYAWSGATGNILLTIDGPQSSAMFGATLAAAGDVNGDLIPDIAVGAYTEDGASLSDAGAVYIFSGANSAILHHLSGTLRREHFGQSVDGVGDLDQDGCDDFIVGAPGMGPLFDLDFGAATVYSGSNGQVLMHFEGAGPLTQLGSGVAGLEDFDGDGIHDLALGSAIASPMGLAQAGTVAIHSGASGALLYTFAGETPYDHLGKLMDSGDFNGDGRSDMVFASAEADPNWQIDSGAAYVRGGFDPYLSSTETVLSSNVGGTVLFTIDFPDSAAGSRYQLLASSQSAASHYHGVDIPLQTTGPVWSRMRNNPPASFTNPTGVLDINGDALCTLVATSGTFSNLINKTLSFAVMAQDDATHFRYSSAAVRLEIVP
jgi:hypothetical protein